MAHLQPESVPLFYWKEWHIINWFIHASKGNTNKGLLSLIECEKYVISTDGNKHGLPDKEAIARIIEHNSNCKLYFNYDDYSNDLFLLEDFEKYKFEICSLSQMNYTIEL